MSYRKRLPSLTALLALEAAARHRSFTAAAKELGVTQAAVSRHVAYLEQEYGAGLFVRGHRSIEPTKPCLALAEALGGSFDDMARAVEGLRSSLGPDVVTIGATVAFTTFWLLPRLPELRRLHPGMHVRLVSQDGRLNLSSGEIDIAIRYGNPPFGDGMTLGTRGDKIMPVCSPAYRDGLMTSRFWETDSDLIEFDTRERGWYTWQDWFAKAGLKDISLRPSVRFGHYTEAIEAARSGQGIALGWHVLVDRFITDGSLVAVGDAAFDVEGFHSIVVPYNARSTAIREIAAQWMSAALEAATTSDPR